MITYAIDPGKHETSVAIMKDVTIRSVFRTTAAQYAGVVPADKIILEVPVSYPGSSSKANDLIAEIVQGSIIAGRIAERTGAPIVIVHPSTTSEAGVSGWKGQVPKPIHHQRILLALSPTELAIVTAIKPDVWQYVQAAVERYHDTRKVTGYKALIHNDLDAIGMLLKDAGRIT